MVKSQNLETATAVFLNAKINLTSEGMQYLGVLTDKQPVYKQLALAM